MGYIKAYVLILLGCSLTAASAQTTAVVNVSISAASPAPTVYPGFSGLSFEKSGINKSQTNTWGGSAVQGLFKSLGQSVMRIGGNSTDQALWAPSYTLTVCASGGNCNYNATSGTCFTVSPASTGGGGCEDVTTPYSVTALYNFLNDTVQGSRPGWQAIWSLNMCLYPSQGSCQAGSYYFMEPTTSQLDTYAQAAAAEAVYVAQTMGTNLLGFELGNEPGGWGSNGVRWSGPVATTKANTCSGGQPKLSFTTNAGAIDALSVSSGGCGCPATITMPITCGGANQCNLVTVQSPSVTTDAMVTCNTSSGSVVASGCTVTQGTGYYYPGYNSIQGSNNTPYGTDYYIEFNAFAEAINTAFSTAGLATPKLIGPADLDAYYKTAPDYFNTNGGGTSPAAQSSMITYHYYDGAQNSTTGDDASTLTNTLLKVGGLSYLNSTYLTDINENINTLSTTIPFRAGESNSFTAEQYSAIEQLTVAAGGTSYHVGDTFSLPTPTSACPVSSADAAATGAVTSVSGGAVTGVSISDAGWGYTTGYPGTGTKSTAATSGTGSGLTVNFTTGNAGNEYGTALWGLDFEFTNAYSSGSGENFSQGVNYHDLWPPVQVNSSGTGDLVNVNPLYYSMYFFNQGLGKLYATSLSTPSGTAPDNLTAYTAKTTSGSNSYYHVFLNNKDFTESVQATVTFPATLASAWSLLMTATPNVVTATSGLTIGGNTINSSGDWTPCAPTGTSCGAMSLKLTGNSATVIVPPGSSMMVTGEVN